LKFEENCSASHVTVIAATFSAHLLNSGVCAVFSIVVLGMAKAFRQNSSY